MTATSTLNSPGTATESKASETSQEPGNKDARPQALYKSTIGERAGKYEGEGAEVKAWIGKQVKAGLSKIGELANGIANRAIGFVKVETLALIEKCQMGRAVKLQEMRHNLTRATASAIENSDLSADEKRELQGTLQAGLAKAKKSMLDQNAAKTNDGAIISPAHRKEAMQRAEASVKVLNSQIVGQIKEKQMLKEVAGLENHLGEQHEKFKRLVDESGLPLNHKLEIMDRVGTLVNQDLSALREQELNGVKYKDAPVAEKIEYLYKAATLFSEFGESQAADIEDRKNKVELADIAELQRKADALQAERHQRVEALRKRGVGRRTINRAIKNSTEPQEA